MKRLIAWLLLAVLLAGCTADPNNGTTGAPGETTGQTSPTENTEPGIYVPDSDTEKQTKGAVRAYKVPSADCAGLMMMGDDLLLFGYADGETANMTVTRYVGENLSQKNETALEGGYSESPYVRVYDNKLAYYSESSGEVIVLDALFHELQRESIPEEGVARPVISSDFSKVYYCTGDQIRVLDMQTGISRMLREQENQSQELTGLYFDDSLLVSSITDGEGDSYYSFISSATGEVLQIDEGMNVFSAAEKGDAYFVQREEGTVTELLFGVYPNSPNVLNLEHESYMSFPLLEANRVLISREGDSGKPVLELYDLETGKMASTLTLGSQWSLQDAVLDSDGAKIWLMAGDINTGETYILRWDPAVSATKDDTVYVSQRFTDDIPDTAGLIECQLQASVLGEKHGVDITIHFDEIAPAEGCTFKGEYQVPAIQKGLARLEAALSKFPEGFFASMASVNKEGKLQIGLVRSISGGDGGVQYWVDGNAHIALAVDDTLDQSFCHQVSHVLDTYILSKSTKMDDWEEELNPSKFSYDYNYEDYLTRTDDTYLTGSKRYFVDAYSMTYPTEDRARIFEYAMTEGHEEIFESKYMQRKLETLCDSIRDSFGWKKDERTFLWEQYLDT